MADPFFITFHAAMWQKRHKLQILQALFRNPLLRPIRARHVELYSRELSVYACSTQTIRLITECSSPQNRCAASAIQKTDTPKNNALKALAALCLPLPPPSGISPGSPDTAAIASGREA
jgi:hypothetical protein